MQGNAQTGQSAAAARKVGRVEGEIGGGISFGADKLNFDKNKLGATFYAEARYNVQRLPLDVGLQAGGTIFHRESVNAGQLKFRTWNVMAVTDCIFRRQGNISFFAGIGLGYAFLNHSAPIAFDDSQPNWGGFSTGTRTGSFCFMPRIGVELFHHLRVTFDYKLQERANRHFGLTLGVVLGGGAQIITGTAQDGGVHPAPLSGSGCAGRRWHFMPPLFCIPAFGKSDAPFADGWRGHAPRVA